MKKLALILVSAVLAVSAMAANKTPAEDAATMKAAKDKSAVPAAPGAAPAAPDKSPVGAPKVKANKTAEQDAASMKDAKDKTKKCVPMPDCQKNK